MYHVLREEELEISTRRRLSLDWGSTGLPTLGQSLVLERHKQLSQVLNGNLQEVGQLGHVDGGVQFEIRSDGGDENLLSDLLQEELGLITHRSGCALGGRR